MGGGGGWGVGGVGGGGVGGGWGGGGGGGLIDMEQDGYESIYPDHDCDLWVTMVG